MGRITLEQAALWCGGKIDSKYKDITFYGANNDSRKLEKGQLFVALQGVRDGHDFVSAALENGAAAILCTHCDGDYPAIVVEDTRIALGQIAAGERQRLGIKVVGITGSVGKSTTKEMVACVLSSTYRVAKTPENYNNDIGMPMAILSIPEDTEIAVLEMGMNHFGEISYLTNIAKPDLAVITNIGTVHVEYLGSVEGILRAKLEILEGMTPGSTVIFNGDNALLWNLRGTLKQNTVYFGTQNPQCDMLGTDIAQKEGQLSFCAKGFPAMTLPMEGEHYVPDALSAMAVGLQLQVAPEEMQKSLSAFHNMAGRQEIYDKNGFTIIQDCYNAGPESMTAALTVLGNRPGRRVAVLGDMLELGVCADAEHYKIGRVAAKNADLLLAYGPNSERMLYGAITGGMSQSSARAFTDREKLLETLKLLAKPGDTILFKGSLGMCMKPLLDTFLEETK